MSEPSLPEPRWIALDAVRSGFAPPRVARWLRDRGSLTRAVVRACGTGRFSVAVRRQRRARALAGERRRLGAGASVCLIREVHLLCDGRPWVFARTLVPVSSLRGAARRLARLRDRPLGALLFADPRTRRLGIEVARIEPGQALYAAACAHLAPELRPRAVWGRRTLFSYAGHPLLVNELFLPPLPEWAE